MSLPQYRMAIGMCRTHKLSKTYDTAADGRLIKRASPDANYFWWRLRQREFATDAELVAHIRKMQPNPHLCLINGLVAPWVDSGAEVQKLAAMSHAEDKRSIVDGMVRHILVDVDDFPADGRGSGDQFRETVAWFDAQLMPGVAGARKIILRSPSSGTKPDALNMRFIQPLRQAVSLRDIEVWAKGAAAAGFPVDPRQSVVGQIGFTASPVIVGGGVDPIAEADRVFVLNPDADVADIDIHEFDHLARQVGERQRRIVDEASAQGWRHAADRLIGEVVKTDSASRFFEPLSVVLGLASRSGESADVIANYLLPLIKQRVAVFDPKDVAGRGAYYSADWIHKHLDSFRRRDAQTAKSIETSLTQIFGAPRKEQ